MANMFRGAFTAMITPMNEDGSVDFEGFRKMVGDDWTPGKNTPFDPIASKKAQDLNLTVICAAGKNIENIRSILDGKQFEGTEIKG